MDDTICRAFLLADSLVILGDVLALCWCIVHRWTHPEDIP